MKTQRPRTPKDNQILLKAMLRAEDRGDYRTLRTFIQRTGHHLKASADAELAAEYKKLLARAEQAFDYEHVHGEGSLFKPEHPANQRIISNLPDRRMEAVEREKARRSGRVIPQMSEDVIQS
jgi:hypothetical protein